MNNGIIQEKNMTALLRRAGTVLCVNPDWGSGRWTGGTSMETEILGRSCCQPMLRSTGWDGRAKRLYPGRDAGEKVEIPSYKENKGQALLGHLVEE